jgi:phytoene dehydrogenase-like protein
MMKFLLDEVFEEAGKHLDDYVKASSLEPMYRLQFKDKTFEPTTDREAMLQQLDACFPGNREGYDKFMQVEKERYESMYPCLQKDYNSLEGISVLIYSKRYQSFHWDDPFSRCWGIISKTINLSFRSHFNQNI